RDDRCNLGPVRGVFGAEHLAHPFFLAAQLHEKGCREEYKPDQRPPFTDEKRRPGNGDEEAGIDGMAYQGVRTGADERVIALYRDARAPVGTEMNARPDREGEADDE